MKSIIQLFQRAASDPTEESINEAKVYVMQQYQGGVLNRETYVNCMKELDILTFKLNGE